MADYYPLIARAIAGLDPGAPGESRRALYERARSALIAQLRSVQPPLTESEITRERLALEEAVRKVESEAAHRARELARTDSQGRPRPGDVFRATTRAAAGRQRERDAAGAPAAPPSSPASSSAASRPRPPLASREDRPAVDDRRSGERPPRSLRPEAPEQNGELPRDHNGEGSRRAMDQQRPPQGPGRPGQGAPGVRGFRDVVADADDLGRATAQANRAARRTYANVPSPSPEFDRMEPSMEDRGGGAPLSYGFEAGGGDEDYAPPRSRGKERQPDRPVGAGGGFPFRAAIILGVVLILAGAGILWGQRSLTYVRGLLGKPATTTVQAPKEVPTAPPPKIADRVGQPGSSETLAPVAQRVVLYDEDPNDPKGKQYVGTVVWRTEQVKGSNGQPGDIAVRADVDIPERKFKMTMSFRRNTDTSLPASHTAELTFILPPDYEGGSVANVPGILMKSNEQARGTPLAGLAVKVTDGFFLIGLSNVESDRVRNIQLLKERSWFDVPLVYSNQRRAIIAIEKGAPGERAFNEAFMAWGE